MESHVQEIINYVCNNDRTLIFDSNEEQIDIKTPEKFNFTFSIKTGDSVLFPNGFDTKEYHQLAFLIIEKCNKLEGINFIHEISKKIIFTTKQSKRGKSFLIFSPTYSTNMSRQTFFLI